MNGFSVAAGDVKVQITGALTTGLSTDANGALSVNSVNFSNAGLSITYDTDPSATSTKLAQIYLKEISVLMRPIRMLLWHRLQSRILG